MKKQWLNPQISNLGIESTKDENEAVFLKDYCCKYCNKKFSKRKDRDAHEEVCFMKPANPGLGSTPVEIPELEFELPLS